MFRWQALEHASELGTITGEKDGAWGVTTGKVNPLTGEPYIRMFRQLVDALMYARKRARGTGQLYYPKRPGESRPQRNPRANIYYIVAMANPLAWTEDAAYRHRVLFGERGGEQHHLDLHDPLTPTGRLGRQPAILVFDAAGKLPNGKIRWKLNNGQSINLINFTDER